MSALGAMGCGISQHGESAFDSGFLTNRDSLIHAAPLARGLGGVDAQRQQLLREEEAQEDPPELSAEQRATQHMLRGNGMVEKFEYTGALKAYTAALALKGDLERAFLERGIVHYKLKDYPNAIDDLTEAIKLGTYTQMAYLVRANIYKEQGELNSALQDCTSVIDSHPEYIEAYKLRSSILQKLGDVENSLADLEKAGMIEEQRYCVICLENLRGEAPFPSFPFLPPPFTPQRVRA